MTTRPKLSVRLRQMPLVFRIAVAMLLAAFAGGQFLQRQPAGSLTRGLIASAARACPSAAFRGKRATVADGAHALDRAVYRRIADHYFPATPSRCKPGERRLSTLGGLWPGRFRALRWRGRTLVHEHRDTEAPGCCHLSRLEPAIYIACDATLEGALTRQLSSVSLLLHHHDEGHERRGGSARIP